MDKENKKLRTEAKKDWNQRVRALVDFVKRKDKRVQAWKTEQDIRLKEKEAVLAKKVAEDKARRQEERRQIWESSKNGHSGAHDDKELKVILLITLSTLFKLNCCNNRENKSIKRNGMLRKN